MSVERKIIEGGGIWEEREWGGKKGKKRGKNKDFYLKKGHQSRLLLELRLLFWLGERLGLWLILREGLLLGLRLGERL